MFRKSIINIIIFLVCRYKVDTRKKYKGQIVRIRHSNQSLAGLCNGCLFSTPTQPHPRSELDSYTRTYPIPGITAVTSMFSI
jgi:hypothetical protein